MLVPRFPRRARLARTAVATALLGLACGSLSACTTTMQDLGAEPTEAQDAQARRAHYEESAQAYYEGGKYERAVQQWKKVLELTPDDQKAKWGLAKSYAQIGTTQSLRMARDLYEQIIDLDWSHPTRGNIKFEVERDYAQVFVDLAEWYQKAIRSDEEKLEASKADEAKVRAHMQEGIAKRNMLLQKAIPLYVHVLQQSENNPYALAGLAEAHLLVGQDLEGVEYGRRYVALSVESQANWQAQLAFIEKEHGEAPSEKQREFFRQKVRGAKEKELKMRLLIASVLMRTGRYGEAIAEYDVVIEKDAARPAAYVERAQAYAMSGDYKKAILDLEKYLQVTDPVRQRESRISAAELLDKYRVASATLKTPVQPSAPGATPAPGTVPSPTARPR